MSAKSVAGESDSSTLRRLTEVGLGCRWSRGVFAARRRTDGCEPKVVADRIEPGLDLPDGAGCAHRKRRASMKKLINDPNDVVAEALLGIEAAHPELRVDHANQIIYRGDAPRAGQGRPHLRRRLGPRAAARRVRRARHARRGVRRRGLHLTGAGPDARRDQAGRRRRRRPARREELHRRRDELRDGGRAGRGRDRVAACSRSSPTTTSRSRTAPGRRAAAESA